MTTPQPISDLAAAGTSVWLDDLSRDRLESGNLAQIIETKGIVGVTTNPAIFASAMSSGDSYQSQLKELAADQILADQAVFSMAVRDVQHACDTFQEVHRATNGVDGWVSLEVDPRLAHDLNNTIKQAKELAQQINRDNLMIKIPATQECLPAITEVLAAGISVNVTLIFSVERYQQVMDAFIAGISKAKDAGRDLSTIHSVASFFISRVDTEIDTQLDALGTDDATALKSKAGLANARLAYRAFQDTLANSTEWHALETAGGRIQRPLWASTSVKNPALPDTLYVTELAGPTTVNTMPEATLDATIDHGVVDGDTLSGLDNEAAEHFSKLEALGIDLDQVWQTLETEGVDKFVTAWEELLAVLDDQLSKAK